MYSVHQHWDPLRVCVVGRSYPPEFYSWITVPHVRSLFERIAIETEEDYQRIIACLQRFGVQILRPGLPNNTPGKPFVPPPMCPRDRFVMIGSKFYWTYQPMTLHQCYDHIIQHVQQQGNTVKQSPMHWINGAMISRIGCDLYFGTEHITQDLNAAIGYVNREFPMYRNHVINTGGHSDSTYCPVAPGLIISLCDVPTYAQTFPGWEVVYLPNQSWARIEPFMKLKKKNHGRWWIPGFENDQAVIDVVEQWLQHWTGYVEETVFDVNMLIIDPKNVIVFNHSDLVCNALSRYGITPHVIPFRHRYFWDGGIHCNTLDLDRSGDQQNFFPERS